MKKMKLFCLAMAILGFLVNPMIMPVYAANEYATIKIGLGKTYKITKGQVEALKNQPGIKFSETKPEKLPEGQIAVALPEELGGGYIIGTAEALASVFNAAGITVGLTPETIISARKTSDTAVAVITIAGILAASLAGRGAAAHHHAPSHH